jgi:hypothetical protein
VVKEIVGVYPQIKAPPGTLIYISAGGQQTSDDPVTWEGPYPFVVGRDTFQDFTISGRYLAVRFASTGQEVWQLSSFSIEIEAVGDR